MRRHSTGFSLIELLLVVAIILIIAAIAIPSFMRSRMAANESAAVSYLRAINSASVTYSTTYGNGFPPSLLALGPPAAPPATCDNSELIDGVLAGGVKAGYNFGYNPLAPRAAAPVGCAAPGGDGFVSQTDPVSVGGTGQRSFCVDHSGIIRFDGTGAVFGLGAVCPAAATPLQ